MWGPRTRLALIVIFSHLLLVCWAVLSHFPPFQYVTCVVAALQIVAISCIFLFASLKLVDPVATSLLHTLVTYDDLVAYTCVVSFKDGDHEVVGLVQGNEYKEYNLVYSSSTNCRSLLAGIGGISRLSSSHNCATIASASSSSPASCTDITSPMT